MKAEQRSALVRLLPAVIVLVVVTTDLSLGSSHSVSSLCVVAPLLASSLVGPRLTLAYGGLAVAAWATLALVHGQFDEATSTSAALFRGGGILVGSGIAFAAAMARERDEARLHRVEQVAEVAQRAILAPLPARLGPLRMAARYESSAQDATVGGDFYAAALTEFGVRILVGDVRGKGLDAVRLATVVLGAFRERVDEHDQLTDLLERLNRSVRRHGADGDFVTAMLVQISDDGSVIIASAGHPAPILSRGGESSLVEFTDIRPPLGIEGVAPATRLQLGARDQLVLYTDGATEARRFGDRHFRDDERLVQDTVCTGSPEQKVERIFDGLRAWTHDHLTDDVAVLAIEYDPRVPTDLTSRPVYSSL